ncbi:hypothetical protein TWF718_008479 [Orbilia javanica]|uniref:Uncharacterized protein n=1 Tax=Orbilia javanica TaxID=47235 RepID=A0AAN8RHD5_9PEZI
MVLSSEATIALIALILGLPALFIGMYQLYLQTKVFGKETRHKPAESGRSQRRGISIPPLAIAHK